MYRVYSLMLISGAAGLIYQMVWARLLQELFGVTLHAVSTVLATFLAGLALGAWLLGRVADRRDNPLRFYGLLEIGIAVTALFGLVALRWVTPLQLWAAGRFEDAPASLALLRIALAAVVVLPSTFLMGGTLPAITRFAVRRVEQAGRKIAVLYAVNTLGAVLGTLAAGFAMIRWWGLHPTLLSAVAANLVVGLVALRITSIGFEQDAALPPAPTAPMSPEPRPLGLLPVMGLAGFVTLALEIYWTRVLMLSVGTTSYALAIMLSSTLTGLSLGGFLAGRIVERVSNMRRLFGWLQLGIGLSILATLPVIASPLFQSWLRGLGGRWLYHTVLSFGVSLLVMLLPTVLIGISFPVAAKIWARRLPDVGRHVGQLFGANTLGNIAGALVGGFVLLPAIGLQKGIALLAALSLLNSAWGFHRSGRAALARRLAVPVAAVAVGAGLMIWDPAPLRSWDERESDEVLFYREGLEATVKVLRGGSASPAMRMTVDGITIGQSFGGVDAKQQALAHFPFLLRPDPPRKVLSIGLGSGVLVGEIARRGGVEVRCVEISPAVVEAARVFDRYNGRVLEHPSVRVVVDDGVNYLRRTDDRYDAIVSDGKSQTAHAGNSSFYSRDYYTVARESLTADGLMIQWIPLDVPPEELATILRTFTGVFPYSYVWMAPPRSIFVVGRTAPLTLDLGHIERELSGPLTANLQRYGWKDAYSFAGMLVADHDSLAGWLSREDTVNTLQHPVLEFYSRRTYAVAPALRRARNLEALVSSGPPPLDNVEMAASARTRVAEHHDLTTRLVSAFALLEGQGEAGADEAMALLDMISETASQSSYLRHASLGAYSRVVGARPDSGRAQAALGRAYRDRGMPGEAIRAMKRAVGLVPENAQHRNDLGVLLGSQGRLEESIEQLSEAVRVAPEYSEARTNLGEALAVADQPRRALREFREAIRSDGDDPRALNDAAQLLLSHPDLEQNSVAEALKLATRAAALTSYLRPSVLVTLAGAYAASDQFPLAIETAEVALCLADEARSADVSTQLRRQLRQYRRLRGA
jgi:spermidine synthase